MRNGDEKTISPRWNGDEKEMTSEMANPMENDVIKTDEPSDPRPLWNLPGVPHSGWACVEVEDTGSRDHLCEMCRARWCRYVHTMTHADYPRDLQVGCVCAGGMEGDPGRAQRRERDLMNRLKREEAARGRWCDPKRWKVSANGNYSRRAGGLILGVYKKDGAWKLRGQSGGRTVWGKGSFQEVEDALHAWLTVVLKSDPAAVYSPE